MPDLFFIIGVPVAALGLLKTRGRRSATWGGATLGRRGPRQVLESGQMTTTLTLPKDSFCQQPC